jgi:hypothetical protein
LTIVTVDWSLLLCFRNIRLARAFFVFGRVLTSACGVIDTSPTSLGSRLTTPIPTVVGSIFIIDFGSIIISNFQTNNTNA